MHPRRPIRALLSVAIPAALACSLFTAPSASAAWTVDATYNQPTNPTSAGWNQHGSFDKNGVFYTVSGGVKTILRYDKAGAKLPDINLTGTTRRDCVLFFCNDTPLIQTIVDVAPSPDGAYIYASQSASPPIRFNRVDANTYAWVPGWTPEKFNAGVVPNHKDPKWTPVGQAIASDGAGNLYLSNGSYWNTAPGDNGVHIEQPKVILKYGADGKFITMFGEQGVFAGQFEANQDIAVSRDGRRVYVGENCGVACKDADPGYQPSRVTRFDYHAGGGYRYTRVISTVGRRPNGGKLDCFDIGTTHSSYTLAMDAKEQLYVGSVSCGMIQRFTTNADPAKDVFDRTIVSESNRAKNHEVSVDAMGRIYASEWQKVIAPKVAPAIAFPLPDAPPLPAPDTVAPQLTNVVVPATTKNKQVAIAITATDNVAVSEMRFADENGNYGPWQPFTTPVNYTLSNGYTIKGISTQVRDMAGNESAAVYRTVHYQAPDDGNGGGDGGGGNNPPVPGDIADPVIVTATAPAVTATRDINIAINATDDTGVKFARFANEDGTWSAYRAYTALSPWKITDGFVNKLIFVQVKDGAGKESNVVQVRTRYAADAPPPAGDPNAPVDTVAPTLTKIELPAEVTAQNANVAITANDNVGVAQVRFANEDGNWTNWQAYAATKAWMLSPNFGPKLVFAQVRDAAGNESLTVTTRTAYVRNAAGPADNADPVLTKIEIPAIVPAAAITVKLTATDDIGVKEVRFANEDGNWGPWKAYGNGQVPHTLTAGNTFKVVFAQVRDAAGRESQSLNITIRVQP